VAEMNEESTKVPASSIFNIDDHRIFIVPLPSCLVGEADGRESILTGRLRIFMNFLLHFFIGSRLYPKSLTIFFVKDLFSFPFKKILVSDCGYDDDNHEK
jgi:hypothetical protein